MRENPSPPRRHPRTRRRGAALVLVLIFGVGALMLVTTMLTMARTSAVQEADQLQSRQLQAVLKAGIAAAVNEINRERSLGAGYTDPEGNGPGAVGCTSGSRDGVAVFAPGTGLLLGRYRAVVERGTTRYGAARDVLIVAAAWPDFTNPVRTLGAEVEVVRQRLPFGANPLSVIGEYDKTKKFFDIKKNTLVTISAPDADVPAANFTDTDFYDDFVANVLPDLALVEGADPSNPGTLVTGASTVTNSDPGVISEETMTQIRSGIEGIVTAAQSDPLTGLLNTAAIAGGGTVNLGSGTFRVSGKLDVPAGTTITGTGTLIIEDELTFKKDATLNWTGNIIVADTNKAKLKVEKDGDLTLMPTTDGSKGVLAVVSSDAEAKLEFQKDANVVLGAPDSNPSDSVDDSRPVALSIIAGSSDDKAKIVFKKDMDFTLYGILSVMASEKIEVKIDKSSSDTEDSTIDIIGSVALVMAEGDDKTELKFTIAKDQEVTMTFDRAVFDGALELLGQFFDPNSTILPMKVTSYWERDTLDVLDDQEGVMDAAPMADWGMP